jgi:L-alanine-DL-glutamate epimerase-like enolase superfamily enzyme
VRLTIAELALPLVHTFTIARGSSSTARTAVFRLQWGDREGLGETAPIARYNESIESVVAHFSAHPPQGDDPYVLEALLAGIPPAARCGLDLALHDLIGKDVDRPLWQLLGLDPTRTPLTSFTIGIDTLETMLAKLEEIRAHPVIKLKLGTANDIELVEAFRSRYTGTLRVDANEGWTPERAVATLHELERFDIEFCEQPIPAGTPERLRWIRERVDIPLVSDEDSLDAKDLPVLRGCVDGVNVKLVKCGGIRAALAMIHTARALGFKVMLGCMVESAILATAAAHLSPLVDWADLDGPFLTKDDPFTGITYDRGKIVLPGGPGLGVRERAPSATR